MAKPNNVNRKFPKKNSKKILSSKKSKLKTDKSTFKKKGNMQRNKKFKRGKKIISKDEQINEKENVIASNKNKEKVKVKRKVETADKLPVNEKKKKHKSEVISKLMEVYENLRRKNTTKDEKLKLIDDVLELTKSNQNQIIFKHDAVRVVEMCVKYGNETQRKEFFTLFKDNTIPLVTSKYGRFLVEKLLEYGSKEQKKIIIESFYGKVKHLIKAKGSASVVDDVYDKYANASQRAFLVEEFYGPEFAIFKVASGRSIDEIIASDPAKKNRILTYMKETLEKLCQREVLRHSIVHRALHDYFQYCDDQNKTDMVEILKEGLPHILHTKEGAKVAMNCLWYGSTKDRKAIIKSFKTYVLKICKEEYGHWVLLALFDVIDDTVLIKKAILSEIFSNIEELMMDQYGRKVLLYLLKPRSSSYFIPELQKLLEHGDKNPYSKKEASVRQKELREPILPKLLSAMVDPINDILKNKSVAVLLLATLEVSPDCKHLENLMLKIVNLIKKPLKDSDNKQDEESTNLICDSCAHWVIKSIIQQDKKRSTEGKELLFSKILCEQLSDGTISDWCTTNRGAFVVVSLLETGIDDVIQFVKNDLKLLEKTTIHNSTKGMEVIRKLLQT